MFDRTLPRTTRRAESSLRIRLLAALVTGILIASSVIVLLGYLPHASAPQVRMTVLGSSVREVGYGESAVYQIDVRNRAQGNGLLELELTDLPSCWEVTLSKRFVNLEANGHEKISLTVTAPTMEAAAEAQRNGDMEWVAAVGLRGGNETIGTTTFLRGSLDLLREGKTTTYHSGEEPFPVKSGDILNVTGHAWINLDVSQLFTDYGLYNGTVTVGLNNATVGFLGVFDTAYMWISRGGAVVYKPGGGGGGVRGESNWTMHIGRDEEVDSGFPDQEYSSVLRFGPNAGEALIGMNVDRSGNPRAAVYDGELTVQNDVGSTTTLEAMETVNGTHDEPLSKGPMTAYMVEVEADGSASETIEVGSRNIFDLEDAHILMGAGGRNIYIIPSARDESLAVTGTIQGSDQGNYRMRFSSMEDYSVRSFEFSSSSTADTHDIITMSEDMVTLESAEEGKTYDLSIRYSDRLTDGVTFNLSGVETSRDAQKIDVEDWESLDESDGTPVSFTQGKITVPLQNGDDGDTIKTKIQKKKEEGDEGFPVAWAGAIVFILIVVMFIMIVMGKKDQGGRLMSPREEWEEQEPGREPGEPDTGEVPDSGSGTAEPGEKEASMRSTFPMTVECHNCGKPYRVRSPSTYRCNGCGGAFKIDEGGRYLKPLDEGRMDKGRMDEGRMDEGRMDEGRMDEGRMDEGRMDEGRMDEGRMDEGRMETGPVGEPTAPAQKVHLSPVQTPVYASGGTGVKGQDGTRTPGKETMTTASGKNDIFPVNVECHRCGKVYQIDTPSVYMCTSCFQPFRIDERGSYLKRRMGKKTGPGKEPGTDRSGTGADLTGRPEDESTILDGNSPPGRNGNERFHAPSDTVYGSCPNCGYTGNKIMDEGKTVCRRCFIEYTL